MPTEYGIGQLARAAGGLTLRTVRYYEERGLITAFGTTPSGRRIYGPEALLVLRQVRLLQETGMSLGEIEQVLAELGRQPTANRARQSACAKVLTDARVRLLARIRALQDLAAVIEKPLAATDTCQRCEASDCSTCSTLANWRRFGFPAEPPQQGDEDGKRS